MNRMARILLVAASLVVLRSALTGVTMPPSPICNKHSAQDRKPCRVPTPVPPVLRNMRGGGTHF
jgi:hypothetical protein